MRAAAHRLAAAQHLATLRSALLFLYLVALLALHLRSLQVLIPPVWRLHVLVGTGRTLLILADAGLSVRSRHLVFCLCLWTLALVLRKPLRINRGASRKERGGGKSKELLVHFRSPALLIGPQHRPESWASLENAALAVCVPRLTIAAFPAWRLCQQPALLLP